MGGKDMIFDKGRLKYIVSGFLLLIAIVLFFAFNTSNVAADREVHISIEKLNKSIQDKINNNPELGLSSNPYDYIVDNDYYDYIISQGISSLPELESILKDSDTNGYNEYIIAIAMEEISMTNIRGVLGDPNVGWGSGKEFEKEWSDIRVNASDRIDTILRESNLSTKEKLTMIEYYGVLAVPAIESFLNTAESKLDNKLYSNLKNQLDKFAFGKNERLLLRDYLDFSIAKG